MSNDFRGDFIGFTFNNIHSSDLNIAHVSDGSRYNETLLPNLQDLTAQVPGGDGMYFWDSYYVQRQFNIQVAFDSITEENFRSIRTWLGDRQIHELWFDETPYKVYMAKIASPPQFKYICFGEGTTNRTYKGEGTIVFNCYYPFAMSKNGKYLSDFSEYSNVSEWSAASGMLASSTGYDTISNSGANNASATVYNPSDLSADWVIQTNLPQGSTSIFTINNVGSLEVDTSKLDWTNIEATYSTATTYNSNYTYYTLEDSEYTVATSVDSSNIGNYYEANASFKLNSRTELLTCTNVSSIEIACNKAITAGDFFRIPNDSTDYTFEMPYATSISYDYLYF